MMSDRERLKRLAEVSSLLLDRRLLALEKAAQARQTSLDRLAELDRPATSADLPPLVVEEIAMRYALWADQRRSDINLTLAKQTAEWVEARQEAAHAFGRNQVLGNLTKLRK
jgi:hypothetical protein